MSLLVVPVDPSGFDGFGKYGLAIDQSAESGGVEGAERVEGIAFQPGALGRGIDEAEIEGGVVPHKDGPGTTVLLHCGAYRLENLEQRLPFII